MELATLQSRSAPANLPLDRLADSKQLSEAQKVAEAGRQFEAILVRQILGEAMKPVIKTEFNAPSAHSGIYQDLIVNQMADSLTRSGGMGLASSLSRDLSRQLSSAPKLSAPIGHD